MSIVQDEANRVNAYDEVMSDFEFSVNRQIADWAYKNKHTAPSYAILVQNYWREVHNINV